MANKVVIKKVKIKAENKAVAEGEVIECKYGGVSSFSIGPFAKNTFTFKFKVAVAELDKPLVFKVKFKQGMNLGIVNDINALVDDMFAQLPVHEGDVVNVEYDRVKPKKCNLIENA
ncbi:MAG: hypothetical protein K2G96_00535 [Clostridia bacterium]|nr:hypothetical protein [Clostridia bacterium]